MKLIEKIKNTRMKANDLAKRVGNRVADGLGDVLTEKVDPLNVPLPLVFNTYTAGAFSAFAAQQVCDGNPYVALGEGIVGLLGVGGVTHNISKKLKAYRKSIKERKQEEKISPVTEVGEKTPSNMIEIMETILGHVGFPKGVVHSLDNLNSYCKEKRIPCIKIPSGDPIDTSILVRFGKGNYVITYDRKGNYKDMNAEFLVEGPVFM